MLPLKVIQGPLLQDFTRPFEASKVVRKDITELIWLGNSYCTQGEGGLSGYNKASGGLIKPL